MKDFTIKQYRVLLETFIQRNTNFQTFHEFLQEPRSKSIMLRHDVDLLPENSLLFARIQNEYGIKGSYYFRAVPESWDDDIIKEIYNLGHEVGYHYENLTTTKGDLKKAYEDFKVNLEKLRKLVPVTTICMHGSPLSRYDSKDLWKEYKYEDLGILGEPYFDVDFNKVLYLTDTGRRWNGANVSVRDKVNTTFKQNYRSTKDIIMAVKENKLPIQVMMTFHPQRWHNFSSLWFKELFYQELKNFVKRVYYVKK